MKLTLIAFSFTVCAQGIAQRPTLAEILATAGQNRASIQSARLRLEQAQLVRRSLTSSLNPSIQFGYSTDVRTGGTDNDLVLTKPFDLFGRNSAFRNLGDAQVFQAEVDLRKSLADIQAQVLESYLVAIASSQKVAIAKQSEDQALKLSKAVQGLVDGGRLPGVQATRATIELEKQRIATKQRISDQSANLKRLSGVTGITSIETGDRFPNFSKDEVTRKQLESQRPDLLAIQGEIKGANAEASAAKTESMPQFEIQARKTPWQADSQSVGARFQFSFPIDNGRVRNQESAARKKAEAAAKLYEDALQIALAETEANGIEIEGAKSTVQGFESILTTTNTLVERTQLGLKEGANTLIDVLDALKAKREVEESLIDARLALAMAHAKYLKSTGTILGAQK